MFNQAQQFNSSTSTAFLPMLLLYAVLLNSIKMREILFRQKEKDEEEKSNYLRLKSKYEGS